MIDILVISFIIYLFIASLRAKNHDSADKTKSSANDFNKWSTSGMDRDHSWYDEEQQRRNLMNKPLSDENEILTPGNDAQLCSKEQLAVYISEIENFIAAIDIEQSYSVRRSIKVLGPDSYSMEDLDPTFQEQLLKLIREKGLTNVEFYNAAWIDRKLFSAINSNKYYKPKKETAVACCFGLKLSLLEAEQLLKAAGYALSNSIRWDKIIKYCLQNDINKIEQVNQILDEMGEKCIGC